MLVVLCIAISSATSLFLTGRNLTNLGFQAAAIVCLALGQLLPILTGGVDISVASTIGLVVAAGSLLYGDHIAGGAIVVTLLAIGATVGAANGLLFVKGRLPHPLIVTLATLGIVQGLALLLTGGNIPAGQPAIINTLGIGQVGPVPDAALLAAGLAFMAWVATKRMRWGRWIYAIGGNPEGARQVGIPVGRVLVSVYVWSGIMAAVAGLIVAGQSGTGDATAGSGFEVNAIAAVMIGGVSFLGGRGGVSNAIVGGLTVTVITNGLSLLNVNSYWQQIANGALIVAAVELNVLRSHVETRFRTLHAAVTDATGENAP
jgi:ribose transport system permease protein